MRPVMRRVALTVAVAMIAACTGGSTDSSESDAIDAPAVAATDVASTEATGNSITESTGVGESPPTTEPPVDEPSDDDRLADLLARPPASIDVVLDVDTVMATIGPDGGTISAQAGDGTLFELTIPPNALLADADVTMATMAEVAGDALGESTAVGVSLGPSGLRFLEAATLTISGSAGDAEMIGFSAGSEGDQFHLIPADTAGDGVSMAITHFSMYGAATPEIAAVIDEYGVSNIGQAALVAAATQQHGLAVRALSGWMAAVNTSLEAAAGSSSLEAATADVAAVLELANNVFVQPWWNAADTDRIAAEFLSLTESWFDAVQTDVDRLEGVCRASNPEAAFWILRWRAIATEFATILRLASLLPPDAWTQSAQACLTFTLNWSSTVTVSESAGQVTTSALATGAPITFETLAFLRESDLTIWEATLTGRELHVTSIEPSFPFPCAFEKSPGLATMGLRIGVTNPAFAGLQEVEIVSMTAIVGADAPITVECQGQDFGFNFYSAEMEILNIPRNNAQGYTEFDLGIVRDDTTFASTSTTDVGTIGSTSTLAQTLTVTIGG